VKVTELSGIQVSSTTSAAFGGKVGGKEGGPADGSRKEGEGGGGVRVVAVDVVARPDGLDDQIEWLRSPGGVALPDELDGLDDALVIAHEWLDVVPCTIAQVDADGTIREVLVDPATGDQTLGHPVGAEDLAWVRDHWPDPAPGETVEVGRQRDLAWADLVGRVRSGTLVAVDYGHTRAARPREGSLTAYAEGRQVDPVPDGSCDLTAHVAMDSLDRDELQTQREVLRGLGVLGRTPPISDAAADPLGYLAGLERAGAEAQLIDPHGFGTFWWAVKRVHVT
jgi:SAM-dependent MidA family methyltransferase